MIMMRNESLSFHFHIMPNVCQIEHIQFRFEILFITRIQLNIKLMEKKGSLREYVRIVPELVRSHWRLIASVAHDILDNDLGKKINVLHFGTSFALP